jgi:hypothetical protein
LAWIAEWKGVIALREALAESLKTAGAIIGTVVAVVAVF